MNHIDFSIAPLNQKNQDFFWGMLYESIYVPPGVKAPPRSVIHEPSISNYVEHWGREGDWAWAAFVEDTPVGLVWQRLFPKSQKGYGFIDESIPEIGIAIQKNYRGNGMGTALLKRAIEEGQGRYSSLCLSVNRENPARKLYQRLGFTLWESKEDSWVMRYDYANVPKL